VNWTIPIYEDTEFSQTQYGHFYLYVEPQGIRDGFEIHIPTQRPINNVNANVGSLGTVNIGHITINGNLNVTFGGNPVPYVSISAHTQEEDNWLSWSRVSSAGQWSMLIPSFNTPTPIYLRVMGFPRILNDGEAVSAHEILFVRNHPLTVQTSNIPGININLGNIPVVPLSPNTWVDGELTQQNIDNWYSISVTSGTTYNLFIDGLQYNIYFYAFNSGNLNPINLEYIDSNHRSFRANFTGTVNIKVGSLGQLGSYAIAYNTTGSIPAPTPPSSPITLTLNTWVDGELTESQTGDWYAFDATAGTTYYLWWTNPQNDDKSGVMNVLVYDRNMNIIPLFNDYGDPAYSSSYYPSYFTPDVNGLVYIRVILRQLYWGPSGTYAIAYNTTGGTKPGSSNGDEVIDFTGTYSGFWDQDTIVNIGATVTSNAITGIASLAGGLIIINDVHFAIGNVITMSGFPVGEWSYIYSGNEKIGIISVNYYPTAIYYIYLGRDVVEDTPLPPEVDGFSNLWIEDMTNTYSAILVKE
jgi:hypothetical protein